MAEEFMGKVAQGVADKRSCAGLQEHLIRAQSFISNCDTQPGLDFSGKIECTARASERRNELRKACKAKCGEDCPLSRSGGKRKSKRANKNAVLVVESLQKADEGVSTVDVKFILGNFQE